MGALTLGALHFSSRLLEVDFQMKQKMCFYLKRQLRTTEAQSVKSSLKIAVH